MSETARAVEADSAAIYLRERTGWTLRYLFGLPADQIGRQFTAEEVKYSELAFSRGEAIIINDPQNDPRARGEMVEAMGITAILDVPLRVGEEILGNFALHYHRPEKHFSEMHADFVDKVAASVTLALRNAE